jgi:type II secretory ATPase GspE/PulE/Tfp pilus assembly ATPase PilB-like protein
MQTISPSDKELRVNQVFSQLDRKYEEEETQRKAAQHKLPYINLFGFPVDTSALGIIPKKEALGLGIVVFYKEGRNLKLGAYEPNEAVLPLLKKLKSDSYYVELYEISKSSLAHFLTGYNKVIATRHTEDEIKIAGQELDVSKVKSLSDLGERLQSATTTQLMESVLTAALGMDSSDIHLEPEPQGIKVRFRIDGVLQDITVLDPNMHHQVISRIKILSKLKLNVVAKPQDGSFSLQYNKSRVDVRVSILPSAFGESVVMRILRQDKGSLRFDDLGIGGVAFERLEQQLQKPNGMVLTTGPTGSGKTTTLYAVLNKLNEPGVKIITLEDPVEYKIAGITQTPIDTNAGLTFAAGLRAILRQDPDIVMVGEMRDLETAETAAQAALTGHIVLSTLHTNDAASALPRLLDLGVKPFILAPAINAIIAQRLVRKICQFCKQEYALDKKITARVDMILKSIPAAAHVRLPKQMKFQHSIGCSKCSGLGYRGRVGVYEIFTMNESIEKLIQNQASTSEIRNQAIKDGMITMAQDGILKVLAGITDVEEVFRVTEE